MKRLSTLLAALFIFLAPAAAQAADANHYNYAHNEAEYSVVLPEAPSTRTIWERGPETAAFMDKPFTDGTALGEVATFKRVDIDSEDVFDVEITFLKAPTEFLTSLTEEKIRAMLEKEMKEQELQNKTFHYSPGKDLLKWASLSGFTSDKNHHPAYSVTHYLTGQQTILVIEVLYSVENKMYQDYYKALVDSIRYNAP